MWYAWAWMALTSLRTTFAAVLTNPTTAAFLYVCKKKKRSTKLQTIPCLVPNVFTSYSPVIFFIFFPSSDCVVSHSYDHIADTCHWTSRYNYFSNTWSEMWSYFRTTSIQQHELTAGSLVTIRGLIFTDVYGSNSKKSSNNINSRFLRYEWKQKCCGQIKIDAERFPYPWSRFIFSHFHY